MPAEPCLPRVRHVNPVYNGYFADPFVWRHGDVYCAVGTGADTAGGSIAGTGVSNADHERVLPLLRSRDLVAWEYVHEALIRPDASLGNEFWAPAVAEHAGVFYLYYSVGGGKADAPGHQLRVAIAKAPEGPFTDVGPLMDAGATPFAIDPHPFRDDDGTWYLFYARDFLDTAHGSRAGTALVVDRLNDMVRLAGDERVVLRARHDWQLFKAQREMYGQTWDWHTLEGPCVVLRDGMYFCFYSGACYGNSTYGVDYATAQHVLGPYDDTGGESGARILSTIPDRVRGPGHNSLIVGPDGNDWLVYHAWNADGSKRQMCIDRLHWSSAGPRCTPTWNVQETARL